VSYRETTGLANLNTPALDSERALDEAAVSIATKLVADGSAEEDVEMADNSASATRGVDPPPCWLDPLGKATTDCITGTVMCSDFLDRLSLIFKA
jgi:hypothetical protein